MTGEAATHAAIAKKNLQKTKTGLAFQFAYFVGTVVFVRWLVKNSQDNMDAFKNKSVLYGGRQHDEWWREKQRMWIMANNEHHYFVVKMLTIAVTFRSFGCSLNHK